MITIQAKSMLYLWETMGFCRHKQEWQSLTTPQVLLLCLVMCVRGWRLRHLFLLVIRQPPPLPMPQEQQAAQPLCRHMVTCRPPQMMALGVSLPISLCLLHCDSPRHLQLCLLMVVISKTARHYSSHNARLVHVQYCSHGHHPQLLQLRCWISRAATTQPHG